MVHKSNIYYSESISKRNLKEYTSSSVTEKNATFQAPSSILSIWRDGLDILDIDTQLNSLKLKWIQRLLMLLSCQCSLKKISCCMFRLNLILNSNQGLALSRKKRILSSKQINEDSWLHFTNNNFPTHTPLKEILDQPIFLNPHTKLDFSSDSPYFYCIPSRNTLGKFVIIRDLCRFLQQGLISYTTSDEKLGFPTANHKRIYKLITDFESTCLD